MLSLAAGFGCERDVAVQPGSLRQPGDLGIIGFDRGVSVDVYASVVHPLQPSASFTPEGGRDRRDALDDFLLSQDPGLSSLAPSSPVGPLPPLEEILATSASTLRHIPKGGTRGVC